MSQFDRIKKDLEAMGGKVDEGSVAVLPDGSGCFTASLPLPEDHWLHAGTKGCEPPPMPLRVGTADPRREALNEAVWAAGKYAVRVTTDNGKLSDFDPDAMVQNFVVGLLGYHTEDGLSEDEWANPDPIPPEFGKS